jgi:hypothetical protein
MVGRQALDLKVLVRIQAPQPKNFYLFPNFYKQYKTIKQRLFFLCYNKFYLYQKIQNFLGGGVTVAQRPLEPLVLVRIQAPQILFST